jgi:hypothetical protein
MRRITLMKTMCSKRLIGGGARRMVTDSGELLQKRMSKLQRLGLPLLDSFLPDVQRGDALLMRYSQHSEGPPSTASCEAPARSCGLVEKIEGVRGRLNG